MVEDTNSAEMTIKGERKEGERPDDEHKRLFSLLFSVWHAAERVRKKRRVRREAEKQHER